MTMMDFLKSKTFLKNLALSIAAFFIFLMVTVGIMNFYTRHGSEKPMPNVVGMQINTIEKVMDNLDFRYEISDSVFDLKMTPGRIYDQDPAAGSKVKTDRMVRLSVYSSVPILATVPDIKDQSVRNAEGELRESGFTIGKVKYVASEYTNLVLEQKCNGHDCVAGTKLPKGSAIDLVVGRSGSSDRTKIPNLSGLRLVEAKSYSATVFLNIGAAVFDSEIKTATDSSKAVVYKQSPTFNEDATLPYGSTVDIWLTNDYTKIE